MTQPERGKIKYKTEIENRTDLPSEPAEEISHFSLFRNFPLAWESYKKNWMFPKDISFDSAHSLPRIALDNNILRSRHNMTCRQ
jgi:hypothetical protein